MLKRFFSYLCIFTLVCLKTIVTPAQSPSWHALPNIGLWGNPWLSTRFEDVYFIDTLTGFAVNLSNGLFKTTDGGQHWVQKNDIKDTAQFRSIEFLDDGKYGIAGAFNKKIFRTSDGGESWTNISSAISDTSSLPYSAKAICGIAHFGNSFYAVGWYGSQIANFYKSVDKGMTWTTTYMDRSLVTGLVDVQFISADTGFVTGCRNTLTYLEGSNRSVVLKTTDGGFSWRTVFSDTTVGGRVWKIQVLDKNNIVASIEPYYDPYSVNMIRSYDGGETWTMIHVGSVPFLTFGAGNQGIGFATTKKGWLGGYYQGIFQTTDGGLTWDTLTIGNDWNRFFVIDSTHIFAGAEMVYFYGDGSSVDVPHLPSQPVAQHILYPVSPNPAKNKIKIEFDLHATTHIELQVTNLDTRHLYQVALDRLPAGHYTYHWNGANAPAGNYMVWLNNDDIPMVQKFVLLK